MSGNAHDGFDATLVRQPRTFDFPTFMEGLRRPITTAQLVEAGENLRDLHQLFEALARDSQPLPDCKVRLLDAWRREFARMKALHAQLLACPAAPSARPEAPAQPSAPGAGDSVTAREARSSIQFDPRLEIEMTLNYWHIEKTAGPDAAEAALAAITKRLRKKKPMGRPRSRPLREVSAAKRDRDRGLTHGQIANKYGFRNGKGAALAIAYHFPDQRPNKKSR